MRTPSLPVRLNSPHRRKVALALLHQAADDARVVGRDRWDFAVEAERLAGLGVQLSDLRRLICEGLIEHAREIASKNGRGRSFKPLHSLRFPAGTCFVLSANGFPRRRGRPAGKDRKTVSRRSSACAVDGPLDGALPSWNPTSREFRVGGRLVKQFRQRGGTQTSVLAAFEQQGWPPRITNPLTPDANSRPSASPRGPLLRYVVQNLNRNQRTRLIHFHLDRRGGVCWKLLR